MAVTNTAIRSPATSCQPDNHPLRAVNQGRQLMLVNVAAPPLPVCPGSDASLVCVMPGLPDPNHCGLSTDIHTVEMHQQLFVQQAQHASCDAVRRTWLNRKQPFCCSKAFFALTWLPATSPCSFAWAVSTGSSRTVSRSVSSVTALHGVAAHGPAGGQSPHPPAQPRCTAAVRQLVQRFNTVGLPPHSAEQGTG